MAYSKQANPDLPVLIRQAAGTPARAFARFGASSVFFAQSGLTKLMCVGVATERGLEKQVALDGADGKEVERRIESLLK